MKNLRDFEELIREQVEKINAEDPNWKWSIRSFSKNKVRIRWTYLDYCEEKENCFFLVLSEYNEEFQDMFITARTPHDEMIDGYIIDCNPVTDMEFKSAIINGIREIADYAHSRY